MLKLVDECIYLIAADEKGASGTNHVQGFCVLTKPWRMGAMKKYMPRAHLEAARGTSQEASDYCKKEGCFEEYGECPVDTRITGKDNEDKWALALSQAKAGMISEIAPDMQVRYWRTWHDIWDLHKPRPVCVDTLMNFWFHGSSGSGKTRWVFENFPGAYPKMLNKWWDHYREEKVVVINEFGRKFDMLSELMKLWADHYPFLGERKGGSMFIRPQVMFVTSNYAPDQVWNESEILEPIKRRFRVYDFDVEKPGEDLVQEIKEFIK